MTTINVPSLQTGFSSSSPPAGLLWFRNGIAPSATGAAALADRYNILLSQRGRCLFAHSFSSASNFDPGSTSNLTSCRWTCNVGPVTTKIRVQFVCLPAITGLPTGSPFAQLVMYPETTGSSSPTTQAAIFVGTNTTTGFSDLRSIEQEYSVGQGQSYRFELHISQEIRPVSIAVFERTLNTLDTATSMAVVNPAAFAQGKPITTDSITQMLTAADELYKHGHQLFSYSCGLPGQEVVRTSATPVNIIDLTSTAPSVVAGSVTPNFPMSTALGFCGTLTSHNIPVITWAYAECPSGIGTIKFVDSNNNTIGTITVSGAATWYALAGNCTDNLGVAPTTAVEVYIAGDGANQLKVYACGMYMHDGADILTVPVLSWLGRRPHYIGYTTELISGNTR